MAIQAFREIRESKVTPELAHKETLEFRVTQEQKELNMNGKVLGLLLQNTQ
jgi:hypothetical protein